MSICFWPDYARRGHRGWRHPGAHPHRCRSRRGRRRSRRIVLAGEPTSTSAMGRSRTPNCCPSSPSETTLSSDCSRPLSGRSPVLGICRASKCSKVFQGGTLPSRSRARRFDLPIDIHHPPGELHRGLHLGMSSYGSSARSNSLHHQTVARSGPGISRLRPGRRRRNRGRGVWAITWSPFNGTRDDAHPPQPRSDLPLARPAVLPLSPGLRAWAKP